jgi:ATP-dependent metalloprotease
MLKKLLLIILLFPMGSTSCFTFNWQNCWSQGAKIAKQIKWKQISFLYSAAMGLLFRRKITSVAQKLTSHLLNPEPIKNNCSFEDYVGVPEKIALLEGLPRIIQEGKNLESLPKAFLFTGKSGCGKTLLVKCLAGQTKSPIFNFQLSAFECALFGKHVFNNYMKAARKAALKSPSKMAIVFMDEMHIFAHGPMLQHLLITLDGIKTSNQDAQKNGYVLIIGATNQPNTLDKALLRSGRFEIKKIKRPTEKNRLLLFQKYLPPSYIKNPDVLTRIVRYSYMCTPADIKTLCNKAVLSMNLGNDSSIDKSLLAEFQELVPNLTSFLAEEDTEEDTEETNNTKNSNKTIDIQPLEFTTKERMYEIRNYEKDSCVFQEKYISTWNAERTDKSGTELV